jgi:capsular polysaccharide biosynthesis protein
VNLGDFQDRRGNLLRDTVRHNWILILVCMLVGAVAGVGLSFARPEKYTSSTTLLINPIVGNPYTPESNSDVLEMLQTEAVAVTSQDTVEQVVNDLGISNLEPVRVRQQTRVSVPPNTQALQISYTSTNRVLAPQIVGAIAETYLADRQVNAEEVQQNRVDRAEQDVGDNETLLDEAQNQDPVDDVLVQIYRTQIETANTSLSNAKQLATDPGRVLTPGQIPPSGRTKHLATFAIIGIILGGIAGIGIGLWRERRRDLVRSAESLGDYSFDAPVTVIHGHDLDDDALRHLRMRLAPQIREHGIVALIGLAPGHAMSTGVLLGSSLATAGTSIVLIDGTGTENGHRDILDFEGKPGLSQALTNHSPTAPTAYKVSKNFGYLPAGEDAVEAAEHLVEDRARTVVRGVAERYDLTLVACMPLENAEGEALARLTAGVLLLVELNRTSHYQLGMALKTIISQGRPLLGVFVLPRGR